MEKSFLCHIVLGAGTCWAATVCVEGRPNISASVFREGKVGVHSVWRCCCRGERHLHPDWRLRSRVSSNVTCLVETGISMMHYIGTAVEKLNFICLHLHHLVKLICSFAPGQNVWTHCVCSYMLYLVCRWRWLNLQWSCIQELFNIFLYPVI